MGASRRPRSNGGYVRVWDTMVWPRVGRSDDVALLCDAMCSVGFRECQLQIWTWSFPSSLPTSAALIFLRLDRQQGPPAHLHGAPRSPTCMLARVPCTDLGNHGSTEGCLSVTSYGPKRTGSACLTTASSENLIVPDSPYLLKPIWLIFHDTSRRQVLQKNSSSAAFPTLRRRHVFAPESDQEDQHEAYHQRPHCQRWSASPEKCGWKDGRRGAGSSPSPPSTATGRRQDVRLCQAPILDSI